MSAGIKVGVFIIWGGTDTKQQHTATHCNTAQRWWIHHMGMEWNVITTHCNTLQHRFSSHRVATTCRLHKCTSFFLSFSFCLFHFVCLFLSFSEKIKTKTSPPPPFPKKLGHLRGPAVIDTPYSSTRNMQKVIDMHRGRETGGPRQKSSSLQRLPTNEKLLA